MASAKAQSIAASKPMNLFQFIVAAICIAMNIADGYDAAAMSNVAPFIRKEWGVSPQVLGVLFSSQAMGMLLGSLLLAPLADRFGRRSIILFSMVLITVSMAASALAPSPEMLGFLRLCTGIALGTMIVSLNVMVVEYSNARWGNILLAFLHSGFAVGTTLSGIISVAVIDPFGWQGIFIAGAMGNAALALLALALMPESLDFLLARQPRNALPRANALLRKLGADPIAALPPRQARTRGGKLPFGGLFASGMAMPTLFLWVTSFIYYMVSYFQFQWTPTILAEAGLPEHLALSSHTVTGLSSFAGNLTMGILASRFGQGRMTGIFFFCAAVALTTLGLAGPQPFLMLGAAGAVSFFVQGGFTGLVICSTRFYPAEVRSTGTGYALGVGRAGALLGPILAGSLIGMGWERSAFYPVFAVMAAIAAVSILLMTSAIKRSAARGPVTLAPVEVEGA